MAKWARRKQDRPAEIVTAALHLFAAKGYGPTTLADVARAAGISKGTVYLYFETKEALFRAVVQQELVPILERFETSLATHQGATADLLAMVMRQFLAVLGSDLSGIPKLVVSEAGNFPEIAKFYAETVVARGLRVIDAMLRRGVARGEFRPVPARDFVPVLVGPFLLLLLWKHSVGKHSEVGFDAEQVLATHLETLLRGLKP